MNERTLEVMPVNSLWMLREKIDTLLASKLISEKDELERRLACITGQNQNLRRRPYPKVHQKYRNPERPDETWSGRGKQPRWFVAQLSAGTTAENLRISLPAMNH
jgi:DNA-binding protein H-NS